jgi:succinoglycan biosynthesis protein ExoM
VESDRSNGGPGTAGPSVSICICTFRRPHGLARLLRSLSGLDPATPAHEIIVVDNDEGRTGEAVVRRSRAEGLGVEYLVEPRRGLARARNRLVEAARGEFIAFIDDDEEADPRWLVELMDATLRHGADGGVGPVIPRFPDSTPRWMIDGGFFDRERPPTGTILTWRQARTGNCLVRRSLLVALPGPFNLAFDRSGGEDSDMFVRLITDGARLVAADSALVHEHLSRDRTSKGWLLRRWFRIAMGTERILLADGSIPASHVESVKTLGRGLWWAVVGGAVFAVSRTRGMRLLRRAARQFGRLAERCGLTYHHYASDSWS